MMERPNYQSFRGYCTNIKPVFATIGLFLSFGYWNDWFQSSLYISEKKLTSLQALLNNMIQNIQYIASNRPQGFTTAV